MQDISQIRCTGDGGTQTSIKPCLHIGVLVHFELFGRKRAGMGRGSKLRTQFEQLCAISSVTQWSPRIWVPFP